VRCPSTQLVNLLQGGGMVSGRQAAAHGCAEYVHTELAEAVEAVRPHQLQPSLFATQQDAEHMDRDVSRHRHRTVGGESVVVHVELGEASAGSGLRGIDAAAEPRQHGFLVGEPRW